MVRKLKVDISFLSVKTVVSSRCERERENVSFYYY